MNVHSFYKVIMEKRTKILEVAELLLAERGFYGLSMKLLADTVGIATGTIYCHFENKDTLINELHQHIRKQSALTLFNGWADNQSPKQKYNLLWRNLFDAVLEKPHRLIVIEMLCFCPKTENEQASLEESKIFSPLVNFYQQGIDEQRFHHWEIPELISLSLESAINLAKKVLKGLYQPNETQLNQVRDASWSIIQKNNLFIKK